MHRSKRPTTAQSWDGIAHYDGDHRSLPFSPDRTKYGLLGR